MKHKRAKEGKKSFQPQALNCKPPNVWLIYQCYFANMKFEMYSFSHQMDSLVTQAHSSPHQKGSGVYLHSAKSGEYYVPINVMPHYHRYGLRWGIVGVSGGIDH